MCHASRTKEYLRLKTWLLLFNCSTLFLVFISKHLDDCVWKDFFKEIVYSFSQIFASTIRFLVQFEHTQELIFPTSATELCLVDKWKFPHLERCSLGKIYYDKSLDQVRSRNSLLVCLLYECNLVLRIFFNPHPSLPLLFDVINYLILARSQILIFCL